MSDWKAELKARALTWRKANDGGNLMVWWPAGSKPGDGSRPIMSINWDQGGVAELGTFYNEQDAERMAFICDVFNWAIEHLTPSTRGFYGDREYL